MSLSHHRRRLALATLTLVVWLTVSAAVAAAKVGPDTPKGPFRRRREPSSSPPSTGPSSPSRPRWPPAIGIAATLAIQLVVHHSHRHSMAHA